MDINDRESVLIEASKEYLPEPLNSCFWQWTDDEQDEDLEEFRKPEYDNLSVDELYQAISDKADELIKKAKETQT